MTSVHLKASALMLRAKFPRVLHVSCVDERLKEMEVSCVLMSLKRSLINR